MSLAVKMNVAPNPIHIGLLGAQAVVLDECSRGRGPRDGVATIDPFPCSVQAPPIEAVALILLVFPPFHHWLFGGLTLCFPSDRWDIFR
jgi:hypothetical protein